MVGTAAVAALGNVIVTTVEGDEFACSRWPPAGIGGCRICGGDLDPPGFDHRLHPTRDGTICQPCWDWADSFRPGRVLAGPATSLRALLDLAVAPLGRGRVADSGFRHFELQWRKSRARVKVDDCGVVTVRRGVRIRGVTGPGGGVFFVVEAGKGLGLVLRRPGSHGIAVPWIGGQRWRGSIPD